MKKGECKLCRQQKQLIRKSHIYPEFMYNVVFDETHRTIYQDLKVEDRYKLYQTGFYDKYILCEYCDNVVLGSLERYGASVLYTTDTATNGVKVSQTIERPGVIIMNVQNIDYKNFKLFVLNLLWKAHISSNPFFKKVSIEELETELRRMLLNGDPGKESDFQVCVVRLDRPDGSIMDMIPNPEVSLNKALKVATFIIGGMAYTIELKKNSEFSMFPEFALKSSNEIKIPRLSGGMARSYLKAMGIPDLHADYFSGTNTSIN